MQHKVLFMNKDQDYIKDLAEIRSMMERSSKFMSLSGWAGIMAGVYALLGAYLAHAFLKFQPDGLNSALEISSDNLVNLVVLAVAVLIFSLVTAIMLSYKKAFKRKEAFWNATSKRLLGAMSVPLVSGGLLTLVALQNGFYGLLVPFTLIFYGLALNSASIFTFKEIRLFGVLLIILGLVACIWVKYSLLFWALGFGVLHIGYGLYIHLTYEK